MHELCLYICFVLLIDDRACQLATLSHDCDIKHTSRKLIDEILSNVDDTTFGEPILTLILEEKNLMFVSIMYFQMRRTGMKSWWLVAHWL